MLTPAQATSFYYARKRNRDARLSIGVSPRSSSIGHQTLAADTTVAQVDALVGDRGVTTLSLTGASASKFKLSGRLVQVKSGTVLAAADLLTVTVKATNTLLGVAQAGIEVKVT